MRVNQAQGLYPRIQGVLTAEQQRTLILQWAAMRRNAAQVAISTQAIRDAQSRYQQQWADLLGAGARRQKAHVQVQQVTMQAQGVIGHQLLAIEQQLATQAREQQRCGRWKRPPGRRSNRPAWRRALQPLEGTYTPQGRLLRGHTHREGINGQSEYPAAHPEQHRGQPGQCRAAPARPCSTGFLALFLLLALVIAVLRRCCGTGGSCMARSGFMIRLALVAWAVTKWPWFLDGLRDLAVSLGLLATGGQLTIAEFLDPGALVQAGAVIGARCSGPRSRPIWGSRPLCRHPLLCGLGRLLCGVCRDGLQESSGGRWSCSLPGQRACACSRP